MNCKKSSLLAAAALSLGLLGLTACNTISGAGKDVSAAGHDVTHVTDQTQDKVTGSTGAAKQ
ncbi:entericidin A/B family lipoprotein [Lichenicoccus roseus]|uniref:Entericidin A/B family lipoprotein n=1 Tax=Lichenicoccus roseus TaxID=2683649 RepID=A0A5R9J5T7_9PROT|nr:entericidin A/B family lipoprotein [Lichenicoccus roseus]TLU72985.1 entericidin A/B family lipoprotein [Lichenicoccus roseus]